MTALPAKADVSGTPSRATANAAFGSWHDFENERFVAGTATAAEKAATRTALETTRAIQPITASVGSNALTITLNPTNLEFRSATLGSGAVTAISVPAAINAVVSSGSTLGTTSGVPSSIVVLAINNGGTVEVAFANASGGLIFDETGLISTTAEGGAGGADSAFTIYSTTARSNVAYRVVGFIESTQATAGTWATAPSKIQGSGGTPRHRFVAQIVEAMNGTANSTASTIPWDDTIPQSGEGTEFYSASITPTSPASLLVIEVDMQLTSSSTAQVIAALFKDSETDARAANASNCVAGAGQPSPVSFSYSMTAGSTSAMTFKVRAGAASGSLTLNGTGGARKLGGVHRSGLRITEYLPA